MIREYAISSGKNGIGQQRDSVVSARQPFRHDAGPDDGGQQQGGADPFGNEASPHRVSIGMTGNRR